MENFQEINPGQNWSWEFKGKKCQARLTGITYEVLETDVKIYKYWFEFWRGGLHTWQQKVYFSKSDHVDPVFDAAFFEKASKTFWPEIAARTLSL